MNRLNSNITIEDIMAQYEQNNAEKKQFQSKFDVKNYLQVRLADNETSKRITVRLLPFSPEGGTPFKEVHFHEVRVNEKISSSGWKRFPCPVKNGKGDKCPFCMTAEQAKELRKSAVLESEKKKYQEIEMSSSARRMYIVRCIERGHEEDGVKFWLFPKSKKNDGVYDKIFSIFTTRMEKAKLKGEDYNIFDLNNGKDLELIIERNPQGKTVININDDDTRSPLSENYEQGNAWIHDTKKWEDVYTFKTYDYMYIVANGGVPVWDKEKNTYVDSLNREEQQEQVEEVKVDLSVPLVKDEIFMTNSSISSTTSLDDDEDLPF